MAAAGAEVTLMVRAVDAVDELRALRASGISLVCEWHA